MLDFKCMTKYFHAQGRIVQRILRLTLAMGLHLLLGACAASTSQQAQPIVGAAAPDFVLPTLSGETLRLSELQGRVVIVNFWATWCPPCLNETPRLVRWYEQHQAEGLAVLGVDTLYQDSRDAVEAFTREQQVSYPVLLDDVGEISRQWQARQLPRSYVIDRAGMVRFVRIGELTERDFEQQVLPLLRQAAGTQPRAATR
jgi:cytochrome c biogenesis protein CcmG, thiol:disulfide interchange protein DsbE